MGMFSWLTGNSDAAEKAVDGAVSLLDNAFYTKEEKAGVGLKMLEFKIRFAEKTQGMSISRRVITCAVTAVWVILVLLLIVLGLWLGKGNVRVEFLFLVMKDIVGPPFLAIVGFYFFAQLASKARGNP